MTSSPVPKPDAVRRGVIVTLELFASSPCQRLLAGDYSPDEVAFELCRFWFEVIYVPSIRNANGLKGNRRADDETAFWNCFSGEERKSLERFHRFLELRFDMRPETARANDVFPIGELWESIGRDASHLLEELGQPPVSRRQLPADIRSRLESRLRG